MTAITASVNQTHLTKELEAFVESIKACLYNLNLKQWANQEAQIADADANFMLMWNENKCHLKNKYKTNLVLLKGVNLINIRITHHFLYERLVQKT